MAGVLIRMKLAVLRGAFRGWSLVGLGILSLAGLAMALLTFNLGLTEFGSPGAAVDILALTCLMWTLSWVVGPALPGGGDETIKPEQFTLLPIRPRRLAAGMLAAAFVGLGPLLTLIAFGSLFGYGLRHGPVVAAVGLLATVLQLVLAVLAGKVVGAAFGALLGTRRGREFGLLLLVAVLCVPGFTARWVGTDVLPALTSGSSQTLSTVVRGLPTGWAAVAVDAADRAAWATLGTAVAGLLAVIGLLLVTWAALLVRRTTNAGRTAGGRDSGADRAQRQILPTTPLGAVVGKELRMWYRNHFRLIFLAAPVAESAWVFFVPGQRNWVAASYLAWLFLRMLNVYGVDNTGKHAGPDLWTTILTPQASRVDVRGRQLAFVLAGAPIAAVLLAVSVRLDGFDALPVAVFLTVLGAAAGLFPLWSVLFPFRTGSPGAGVRLAGAMLLFAPVLAVPLAPVVAVSVLGPDWLSIPVGALLGATLAWWLGRLAYRRLTLRGPEILSTLRGVTPAAA